MTLRKAFEHAKRHGPSDETRQIVCKDSFYAYKYAKEIDQKPRKDTREAACIDAMWACHYALYIDKRPRKDTRKAACKESHWAWYYVKNIDKKFRNDTWMAIKNTIYAEEYKKLFNNQMKEEII